jgi:hypothetical protein
VQQKAAPKGGPKKRSLRAKRLSRAPVAHVGFCGLNGSPGRRLPRNKLEARITALERNRQQNSGVELVVIHGGLQRPDLDPTFGKVGDLRLERGGDESFAAFTDRAKAAAVLAGERLVVLGGLGE